MIISTSNIFLLHGYFLLVYFIGRSVHLHTHTPRGLSPKLHIFSAGVEAHFAKKFETQKKL